MSAYQFLHAGKIITIWAHTEREAFRLYRRGRGRAVKAFASTTYASLYSVKRAKP